MRADRLLSLLMLLQTRGRMTAVQLSKELEVSKRTIYRDIDSLSISGIPVYADGGPGGGYSLLDSYQTDLTGLSKEEMEALFLLSIPGPIADLQINRELKNALLKLSSSLPADLKKTENLLKQRIHLDAGAWFQKSEETFFLTQIQDAVWQDKKIRIQYKNKSGRESERIISPLALVAKAGIWYLIGDTEKGYRIFRVSRVTSLNILTENFERSPDFILEDYWREWCSDFEKSLKKYETILSFSPEGQKISEEVWGHLREQFKTAESDDRGWKKIAFNFANIYEATGQILDFGPLIKVLEPLELQKRVSEQARAIVKLYN